VVVGSTGLAAAGNNLPIRAIGVGSDDPASDVFSKTCVLARHMRGVTLKKDVMGRAK